VGNQDLFETNLEMLPYVLAFLRLYKFKKKWRKGKKKKKKCSLQLSTATSFNQTVLGSVKSNLHTLHFPTCELIGATASSGGI